MPQKIPCRVAEVIDHGDRVYSVLLRPQARLPRFVAGQFLHLALDHFEPGDFWPESRVFSIASPSSQPDLLKITYSVKGIFTTRMEIELCPGREVWVKLPYGEFAVDRHKDGCLLAGGTGITAFAAYLGQLTADQPNRVLLFYGARRQDLLVYRSAVEEAGRRCSRLTVHLFAEQGMEAGSSVMPGRLDIDHIWPLLDEPAGLTYYIAGPPAMIAGLTGGLRARGMRDYQILVDAWE